MAGRNAKSQEADRSIIFKRIYGNRLEDRRWIEPWIVSNNRLLC
jgi:hypothetical protein